MARKFWRTPLDPGPPPPARGEVHVIGERCKGCGYCIEFCPRDVLVESSAINRRGYRPPETLDEAHCAECHLCELLCPEFAIFVTPEAAASTAAPEGGEGFRV